MRGLFDPAQHFVAVVPHPDVDRRIVCRCATCRHTLSGAFQKFEKRIFDRCILWVDEDVFGIGRVIAGPQNALAVGGLPSALFRAFGEMKKRASARRT